MKKLCIALMIGIGLNGFAQETAPKPNKEKKEQRTPEQRQQKRLSHLTKELNLDAKQQEQVGQIIAEKSGAMQDVKTQKATQKASGDKMTREEKEVFKTQLQAEKADADTKMKNVLSEDQYQKWLSIQEKNKERIINRKELKKE